MATVTWVGGVGNWETGSKWSTGSPPGSGDDAVLGPISSEVFLTTAVTVNSISLTTYATLQIADPGGTESVTGDLANAGGLSLDGATGNGGTTLVVGGTLANTGTLASADSLVIGNDGLTANTTVTASAFDNTGTFSLLGSNNSGTNFQATLRVAAPAPTTWIGNGTVAGDALLQFASGGINAIASGTRLSLGEAGGGTDLQNSGTQARIALASDTSRNSALDTLTSNAGTFVLADGALVTTSSGIDFTNSGTTELADRANLQIGGTLTNSGTLRIDGTTGGDGGGRITAKGLSNTGFIKLNNPASSANPAVLEITAAAPSTWTGDANLAGATAFDPGSDLIEFASGAITSIASGAAITLNGSQARIAVKADPSSNSALTSLADLSGGLELDNGASLTTAPGVNVLATGGFSLDSSKGSTGGGALTINGTLTVTNTSLILIGNINATGSTTVTASNLINNTGIDQIQVAGSDISSPILKITGTTSGSGWLGVGGKHAIVEFGGPVASGQLINISGTIGGTVALDAPSQFAATISGLWVGGSATTPVNQIDLTTIAPGSITAASLDTSSDKLSVTTSTSGTPLTLQLTGSYAPGTQVNWITDGSGSGSDLFLSTPVCFCRGTRILTARGEVAVEALAVGDRVMTLAGRLKPIVWIGFGRELVTRVNRLARPVIVRRGALADHIPHRDLYLTHGHALYLRGVLIPVEHLVNHRSILWDDSARVVEYYHIELADHDLVFADGAPAETYYDAANRAQFHNTLPRSRPGAEKQTCAPVLNGGPLVDEVWAALFRRAGGEIACRTTEDPDLHLVVAGLRREPIAAANGVYHFALEQPRRQTIRLCSRSAVPSLVGSHPSDHRRLGVAIRRIELSQPGHASRCFLHSARLLAAGGCHPAEREYCWTDGELALPSPMFAGLSGPLMLTVHIAPTAIRYPLSRSQVSAAA